MFLIQIHTILYATLNTWVNDAWSVSVAELCGHQPDTLLWKMMHVKEEHVCHTFQQQKPASLTSFVLFLQIKLAKIKNKILVDLLKE